MQATNQKHIISITPEMQVGAVVYKQRPSTPQMENLELSTIDDYMSYSITMLTTDAAAKMEEILAQANTDREKGDLVQVQATATTIAGGMTEISVRITGLRHNPKGGNETEPDPDPEEEPSEEEEKEAGEGPENAKVLSVSISFQENPLPVHHFYTELAESGVAGTRDAIGIVHKGGNVYKPIPTDDNADDLKTPHEILGDEICSELQRIPTFKTILFNIDFSYKTGRRLTSAKKSMKIGEVIPLSELPSNQLGSSFDARHCKARFLGRDCTKSSEESKWQIHEKYLVERIPEIEEIRKEYEKSQRQ